ncbi:MAG: alpha/beta fold hydrolase [Gemmatimonadaceae bacterium]|jgi:pimeloyl-ACP methyl ester carboxylesterase|nr:alpha/beta fold hydrolase [Gemmatimonadaceae bacterium]
MRLRLAAICVCVSGAAAVPPPTTSNLSVGDGESLFVARYGPRDGEPVLILPGPVGSDAAHAKVAERLAARGRHVVVMDPLGMGRSARPRGADYSLAAQSERIARASARLGMTRVTVVAQGVSASIAWFLAARHPSLIDGIVSIEGGIVEQQGTPGLSRTRALAPLARTPIGRMIARRRFHRALVDASHDGAWVTDSVVDRYLAPMLHDLPGTLAVLDRMQRTAPDSTRRVLPAVRAPVTLLLGRDRRGEAGAVRADEVAALAALVHARVDTVDRSGPHIQQERPDAVVAAVDALPRRALTADRSPD